MSVQFGKVLPAAEPYRRRLLSTRATSFDKRDAKRVSSEASARATGGNMKLALLLTPCLLALWTPLYNSTEPFLFGVPFFYWFLLLLVPVSALTIFAADRIGNR